MHFNKFFKADFYRRRKFKNAITIIRLLIGVFFLFSGGTKFWSVSSFSEVLSGYSFLPQILLPVLSYGIPAFEMVFGLLLLIDWRISAVSMSLLVMVFIFTITAFVKYQSGQVGDCGCFGELLERENNWVLFAENTILMILLGILQLRTSGGDQ